MTGDPPRHEPPYPGVEERLARIEGWRGTVDEWRRGVDAWRRTIEREGLVTAVAVMGTKLDHVMRKVDAIESIVDDLDDARLTRSGEQGGIRLTWKVIAGTVAALAAAGGLVGMLVALLAGGPT
jgi:hypothetical protein